MKNTDTKTVLIVGAIMIALIIYLARRPRSTTIVERQGLGNITLGGVSIPALQLDMPRASFDLPAFALPPDQFSMISGCCSDCSSSDAQVTSYQQAASPLTIVFNEGNTGGTTYNYTSAPAPAPYSGGPFISIGASY